MKGLTLLYPLTLSYIVQHVISKETNCLIDRLNLINFWIFVYFFKQACVNYFQARHMIALCAFTHKFILQMYYYTHLFTSVPYFFKKAIRE